MVVCVCCFIKHYEYMCNFSHSCTYKWRNLSLSEGHKEHRLGSVWVEQSDHTGAQQTRSVWAEGGGEEQGIDILQNKCISLLIKTVYKVFSGNNEACDFRFCLLWAASVKLCLIWLKPYSCSLQPDSTDTEERCSSYQRCTHDTAVLAARMHFDFHLNRL